MNPAGSIKPCPFCGEEIKGVAIKCRFCGEWLEERPATRPTDSWAAGPKPTLAPAAPPRPEPEKVARSQAPTTRGWFLFRLSNANSRVVGAIMIACGGLSAFAISDVLNKSQDASPTGSSSGDAVFMVAELVAAGIAIWTAASGLNLWRKGWPGGVSNAVRLLPGMLLAVVVAIGMFMSSGASTRAADASDLATGASTSATYTDAYGYTSVEQTALLAGCAQLGGTDSGCSCILNQVEASLPHEEFLLESAVKMQQGHYPPAVDLAYGAAVKDSGCPTPFVSSPANPAPGLVGAAPSGWLLRILVSDDPTLLKDDDRNGVVNTCDVGGGGIHSFDLDGDGIWDRYEAWYDPRMNDRNGDGILDQCFTSQ